MNPNQTAAYKLIEQAQEAMKTGELQSARQFAAQAAQLAPELEEVWLILAALVPPRESLSCLRRALSINPQSERAQKGLLWAQKRLQQEVEKQSAPPPATIIVADQNPAPTEDPTGWKEEKPAPVESQAERSKPVVIAFGQEQDEAPLAETQPKATEQPQSAQTSAVLEPKTSPNRKPETPPQPAQPVKTLPGQKAVARPRASFAILLLVLICLVVAAVLTQATSVMAFFYSNALTGREHGPAWAVSNLSKPTSVQGQDLAPVVEATRTLAPTSAPDLAIPPTASDTPFPTETTPPTATQTPTLVVPTATETPLPTATLLPPTALPSSTPAPEVVFNDSASPTPLPTDTAVPIPTQYVAPTPKPNTAGNSGTTAGSGEHWIDVDLTNQMVYAYEGNTLVNSFVTSTGTWQHPTVTGQYRVYIKYRYKDMSGPGYYLPNVPFTMFFYSGYAIHGTYWHNNFGTPMSHGCVNLTIPDAEWVYNFSSVGTLVNVHY